MSENLASAVSEVRYYEKRKYNVAVKAAECFPRDRIASSAAEFLCNAGQVIKNSRTGCDQKSQQQSSLSGTVADLWRIGKAEQVQTDSPLDTAFMKAIRREKPYRAQASPRTLCVRVSNAPVCHHSA